MPDVKAPVSGVSLTVLNRSSGCTLLNPPIGVVPLKFVSFVFSVSMMWNVVSRCALFSLALLTVG